MTNEAKILFLPRCSECGTEIRTEVTWQQKIEEIACQAFGRGDLYKVKQTIINSPTCPGCHRPFESIEIGNSSFRRNRDYD